MLEFYILPTAVTIAVLMLSALGVTFQAVVAVGGFSRIKTSRALLLENLLEVLILIQVFSLSLMLSQVTTNIMGGFAALGMYDFARFCIFAAIVVVSASAALMSKSIWKIVCILPAAVTLPFIEKLAYSAFPWIFTAVLTFWIIRAAYIYISRRREIRGQISGLSVKRAIDALHTGLLFSGTEGTIYLMNRRMQQLMIALTGKVQRNGKNFRDILVRGETLIPTESITLSGHLVYRLTDGTAWMFSEHALSGVPKYFQLSAADVTEQWSLTEALREQEELLVRRGKELENTLLNLEEIRRSEELLSVRSKVHDIMAQRLAMLIRVLRAEEELEASALESFADNLLEDVRAEAETDTAPNMTEALCRDFAVLGVTVDINGAPPHEAKYAAFFGDFVREGVTNAVRHGFATKISILCEDTTEKLVVSLSDNGFVPAGGIVERGGIIEIRRRLAKLAGTLEIEAAEHLRLTASIRKTDEKEGNPV